MSRHVPAKYHKWYSKNYEKKMELVYKRRNSIKEWLRNLKLSKLCRACKAKPDEKTLRKFDFHHKDKETKLQTVSDLVCSGYSLKVIKNEIKKCSFLCSECHDALS